MDRIVEPDIPAALCTDWCVVFDILIPMRVDGDRLARPIEFGRVLDHSGRNHVQLDIAPLSLKRSSPYRQNYRRPSRMGPGPEAGSGIVVGNVENAGRRRQDDDPRPLFLELLKRRELHPSGVPGKGPQALNRVHDLG